MNELKRKPQRLSAQAEVANRLMALANDPAVQAWFDLTDKNIVGELIATSDDNERREWAATARALRDLRQFLTQAIDGGQRAQRDLDEMR